MKRFAALSLSMVLFLEAGWSGAGSAAEATGNEDEAAIRAIIARMAVAWNAHDVPSFVDPFASDADVVNRFGLWFHGKAKIEEHLAELHRSPFRDQLVNRTSTVEALRFLTPDVALVHERAREEAGDSIRTYVLTRREGRWKIVSATVTGVANRPPGPPARGQ